MFLLDTNVVSELRKARAGKADRNVTTWVETVPAGSLFLSVIVVQELEIGRVSNPGHTGGWVDAGGAGW